MKSKLPTGPLLTGDVSPSPLDPSDNGLKVMHYANKQPCYKNANKCSNISASAYLPRDPTALSECRVHLAFSAKPRIINFRVRKAN